MRISCDCFVNFVTDIRTTFVRVSHECRENFQVSQSSLELVAKVLNMFKFSFFILVSNVCNLRIGIVHYNSTNVKRILYALNSFTEDFNIHPLRKKGTYYKCHLRRNYVYLKKSAMWHPILI